MATEIKIPPMGESVTTGFLAAWHVADGDTVALDQEIYTLETDKITHEGTAPADGVIRISVEADEEVEIGQVIGTVEEGAGSGDSSGGKKASADAETSKSERKAGAKADADEDSDAESDQDDDAEDAGKSHDHQSPAVRRIAAETGVDPAKVKGTGKDGRVTKGDMLKAAESKDAKSTEAKAEDAPKRKPVGGSILRGKADSAPKAGAPAETSGSTAKSTADRQTRKRMSPLRKKIAERLVNAQRQAALLTTFNECDMSAVMSLRKQHQDAFVKKNGLKLGFMSFFTKAVVHALKEVPAVNAQIDGDEMVQNNYYDVGIAVSTERGLLVPVVRDCDTLSFAEIETRIGEFAQKARDGKISIDDLQGGVFTITNGGIFGSMLSTPILNPPQSGILGMHTIQQRPVAVDGQVVIRPMMYLALTYDHRIVDGREAVTFLVKVKEAIEDPTRLLLQV